MHHKRNRRGSRACKREVRRIGRKRERLAAEQAMRGGSARIIWGGWGHRPDHPPIVDNDDTLC
jgi:hypothetical protein